jgi:hypothetical protein
VKTREENKSERMHPERNKNIPTYLVGMRRKRKQKWKNAS